MPTEFIADDVCKKLKALKLHQRESYSDVIKRLLEDRVTPGKD